MGYSLAGWVGLLHPVLHGLACLSGSWAVGTLLGVGWGWLPSAFLRYVGWGGVFSVSWLCCGGWDGRSSQAAPFGWGFLVPCGASVCWFWMYGRPSQSVCPRSLPHNLWLSSVPSVLRFSSGSLRFWSIFFSVWVPGYKGWSSCNVWGGNSMVGGTGEYLPYSTMSLLHSTLLYITYLGSTSLYFPLLYCTMALLHSTYSTLSYHGSI